MKKVQKLPVHTSLNTKNSGLGSVISLFFLDYSPSFSITPKEG